MIRFVLLFKAKGIGEVAQGLGVERKEKGSQEQRSLRDINRQSWEATSSNGDNMCSQKGRRTK